MILPLMLLLMPFAEAFTIGISPPKVELGYVEPGKTYQLTFVIFNPNKQAATFAIEADGNLRLEKKTIRVKGGAAAQLQVVATAPQEEGEHNSSLTVMPNKKGEGLVPGLSATVRMRVRNASVGKSDAAANPITTQIMGPVAVTSSRSNRGPQPSRFVGGSIIAGIVGPGLLVYNLSRRGPKSAKKAHRLRATRKTPVS